MGAASWSCIGAIGWAVLLAAPGLLAATPELPAGAPSVDELIEGFDAAPAGASEGEVRLDAWVEDEGEQRAVVIVFDPEGRTKLIADPGITVTPVAQPGVRWLLPLPHRHVDASREYFEPPAAIRLPFVAEGDGPIELLVEYAYCVIDYQCFFGEETLTVESRINESRAGG